MNSYNICFYGETRKTSALFRCKVALWSYEEVYHRALLIYPKKKIKMYESHSVDPDCWDRTRLVSVYSTCYPLKRWQNCLSDLSQPIALYWHFTALFHMMSLKYRMDGFSVNKWLSPMHVWLVIRRSWVWSQRGLAHSLWRLIMK